MRVAEKHWTVRFFKERGDIAKALASFEIAYVAFEKSRMKFAKPRNVYAKLRTTLARFWVVRGELPRGL